VVTEDRPSLEELMAKSERAGKGLRARRNELGERRHIARDDWGLVEIVTNGHGEIVEAAVNADVLPRAGARELAEAILQAARAAQTRARNPEGAAKRPEER
jgi:DNA-binding protein YbaB